MSKRYAKPEKIFFGMVFALETLRNCKERFCLQGKEAMV